MGYGDEIMAAGVAEHVARAVNGQVAIVDRAGRPRWSEVWLNHPDIAVPKAAEAAKARVVNCPTARPYIDRWTTWHGQPSHVFSKVWRARDYPAKIYLAEDELSMARKILQDRGPFVIIDPTMRPARGPNRDLGWEKYQAVVERMRDVQFYQVGPNPSVENVEKCTLRGASYIATFTFREACAMLAMASAYVGPEGGLHHAAAAVGARAVVVFGEHTDPETTGYESHTNIYTGKPGEPCGHFAPCDGCREAMERISVDQVVNALRGILNAL